MSATGTQLTKGERLAQEMAKQLGGVAVRAGSGGMTLVTKAEAQRRNLIDKARTELEQKEQAAKALDKEADATAQLAKSKKAKRIPAALNLVPTPKAGKSKKATAAAPVLTVVQGTEIPAGHKRCSKCKQVLPFDAFASDKSNKRDGRYGMCRADEKIGRDAVKAAKLAAAQPVAPVAVAATPAPKAKKAAKK